MDHWRLAYLGMRQIPRELSEFELATFFTYSPKERALIDARRGPLYRLAVAVHIGFIRMTGRTLDTCKQVPRFLWWHVGAQVGVTPPDTGTLNAIPIELARQDASLAAVSSGLTLLSNSVMAWNTMHMQRSWDILERISGETIRSEGLRHIGPTHLAGINLRGTFEFPIARYAHRLMPTSAFQSDSPSQWRTA